MGGFTQGAFSDLGTQNQTIAASGNYVFGAVSNAGKTSTTVAVDVTYNASATKGVDILIEREATNTPGYESQASAWTIPVPFTAGTTVTKTVSLDGNLFGECQVRVVNTDTAQSATAVNCRIAQSTYAA
jgi:hypothetical protein